jgi:phosphate transport system permease protein
MNLTNTQEQTQNAALKLRHRNASAWKAIFFISIMIGIISLTTLLFTVINKSFGYVVEEYKVQPVDVSSKPLDKMTQEELITTLRSNMTPNRFNTLDKEKPMRERSVRDLRGLIIQRILQPKTLATFSLFESIVQKEKISSLVADKYPGAVLRFHNWINIDFLTNTMSSQAMFSGIRTAFFGSLFIILITISFAFPVGIGAAIYLEEYANKRLWINRVIQTNIDNLAGVPSIVYGILGLAIFVRILEPFTSGEIFGVTSNNGRTILSAGLTMGLLILPVLIINAQEAIRAVPNSLRQASYGLGATQWETIWYHVLPYGLPGILTGTILAISRAMGETAPLIVIGALTFIDKDPTGLFSHFTALPIQIYNWTQRPQDEFRNIAAAAIIVLLIMLLSINSAAILLRNRFSKRY